MKAFFITATDTDVGKTFVCSHLLHAAQSRQLQVRAFKPVASGSRIYRKNTINDDVFLLHHAIQKKQPMDEINLYHFDEAIAPHIAARKQACQIDVAAIVRHIKSHEKPGDLLLVEGVGGWQVPLNQYQTIADLAMQLYYPVIVVVKIQTGCINHALLTLKSIQDQEVPLAGWIANYVSDDDVCLENILAIEQFSQVRCLGLLPVSAHGSFSSQLRYFKNQPPDELFVQLLDVLMNDKDR